MEQNETTNSKDVSAKLNLTEDLLLATAKETVSISASCKKQIEDMRKIFEESSFKDATTGKMTKK